VRLNVSAPPPASQPAPPTEVPILIRQPVNTPVFLNFLNRK
jgi:hypothetical protein